jgi:hypothetical protein
MPFFAHTWSTIADPEVLFLDLLVQAREQAVLLNIETELRILRSASRQQV